MQVWNNLINNFIQYTFIPLSSIVEGSIMSSDPKKRLTKKLDGILVAPWWNTEKKRYESSGNIIESMLVNENLSKIIVCLLIGKRTQNIFLNNVCSMISSYGSVNHSLRKKKNLNTLKTCFQTIFLFLKLFIYRCLAIAAILLLVNNISSIS